MTWGDSHYLGLTGLEVVGKDGESLPLDLSMISASPRDLNDLPECRHDLRTLDKYDPLNPVPELILRSVPVFSGCCHPTGLSMATTSRPRTTTCG